MQATRGPVVLHIPPVYAWWCEHCMGRGAQQAAGLAHTWDAVDAWTRVYADMAEPAFRMAQSVPWSPLRMYEMWLAQVFGTGVADDRGTAPGQTERVS